MMVTQLLTLLYLLFVPWAVMRLAERWSWISKISPMTVLYFIGIVVCNCGLLSEGDTRLCATVSSLAVPLAIPLMLMTCSLKGWKVGQALKVFLTGLLSVMIVVVSGYFIFRGQGSLSDENYAQICAVSTGIYTGGIPNIGAIAQAVRMPNSLYILVTSSDLIITGLYLVFIIFFGKPLFRGLLGAPADLPSDSAVSSEELEQPAAEHPCRPFSRGMWKGSLLLIGATLLIAAVSYGVSLLPSGGKEPHMTLLILLLTTLAIGASFIKPVQRQRQAFDMGLYCVYVFCLAIATQVNISEMRLGENISVIYYIAYVIFGSLVLQFLFARLLKIDGDSVMVCSVALINSPPFVPMVAAMLKNRNIVVLGISIGLLGYMIGNYLGIAIFHLLR